MPFQRSIMLGVVGDSAAGKTTLTEGIARVLGGIDRVTTMCTDDYHRYDRQQRRDLNISALDPACNYIDIMEQQLDLLRRGHPILKPVYNHGTGRFDPPEYLRPKEFIIVDGLLGFHSKAMRRPFDIKVFLAPENDLRIQWKIKRDTAKRGYTTEEVISSLKKRTHDSDNFILPQQQYADIVIRFYRPQDSPEEHGSHLNVQLKLRPNLPHPDLSEVIRIGIADHVLTSTITREDGRLTEILDINGSITTEQANTLKEVIWNHLPEDISRSRPEGFGDYLDGAQNCTSNTLALAQLMVAYHMLLARNELDADLEERRKSGMI